MWSQQYCICCISSFQVFRLFGHKVILADLFMLTSCAGVSFQFTSVQQVAGSFLHGIRFLCYTCWLVFLGSGNRKRYNVCMRRRKRMLLPSAYLAGIYLGDDARLFLTRMLLSIMCVFTKLMNKLTILFPLSCCTFFSSNINFLKSKFFFSLPIKEILNFCLSLSICVCVKIKLKKMLICGVPSRTIF